MLITCPYSCDGKNIFDIKDDKKLSIKKIHKILTDLWFRNQTLQNELHLYNFIKKNTKKP